MLCFGKRPELGIHDGSFTPCPSSPNCVSSDTDDSLHRVEAYALRADPQEAWAAIGRAVADLPRASRVRETPDYMHVECRSALIGFVDDLELHLRPDAGMIAVRSASRVGYSDLGANRKRVEALRSLLVERGVIHP